jgi:uncharacterized protein (TIGR03435 family)
MQPAPEDSPPFSPATLHVIPALTSEDLHGHGVMLEVARPSGGTYKIGTTHHLTSLYLDRLPSMLRPWAFHLFPPASQRPCAQASLLSGDYVPLSQLHPGRYELFRAARLATILLSLAGFATEPCEGIAQIANAGTSTASTPGAAYAQGATLRFDVVTVKLSDPAKEHDAMYWRQPDGLKWDGVTLSGMIANAYGVSRIVKGQIEGGPSWMGSRAFDINAKVDAETATRWSKMTQPEIDEERRSMTRSLLADRFHLKFHHETRQMSALVLRLAKSGPKLQPQHPQQDLQAGIPPNRINFLGRGHLEGHSALMSNLVRSLASEYEIAGRPVVDKTGLTGGYDFLLRWTPDDLPSESAPADPNAKWPSLFTAIDEQLGLKLTPEKQPIDIIVADSADMPDEN